MKTTLKNIYIWLYIHIHSIFMNIGIILSRSEDQVFRVDPDVSEKNKLNYNKLHRIPFINKMNQGVKDEKYVQDYYELLKKSETFLRKSTSNRIAQVADRFSMSLGREDLSGEKHDHFGFFDENHKHYGKTLQEVLDLELDERRLKDDNYEILYVFNNKPIDVSLSKAWHDHIIETDENSYIGLTEAQKALTHKFPMTAERDIETNNKIERLAEIVYVKRLDETNRIFEFFIPKKYKLYQQDENSDIFKQVVNFKRFWFTDEYGQKIGFTVDEYLKHITDFNDQYEILKFSGVEIIKMNN